MAYVTIRNAGSQNGGIMPMTEAHGDTPPYWLPYFTVASCDGAIAKVGELGGGVLAGPMGLEAGLIAALTDPRGRCSPSSRARPRTSRTEPVT